MENLIFRKAEEKDREKLDELCKLIFKEHLPRYKEITGYCIVIHDDIYIAMGYLCDNGKLEYEKDLYITCMNYDLEDFGVHPDYRKKGIGTRLFQFMYDSVEYYKGVARIEFWVDIGVFDFWKKSTKNTNITFREVCHSELPLDECKCETCKGDGLDVYTSSFIDTKTVSHFCYIVKLFKENCK